MQGRARLCLAAVSVLGAGFAGVGCGGGHTSDRTQTHSGVVAGAASSPIDAIDMHEVPEHEEEHPHEQLPLDGKDFPDGVLALTWDDGPDEQTLALAKELRKHHVAATFFVVGEWIPNVSEEPGVGPNIWKTGYAHLPILGDLVKLGHRLGSHTRNHVVLSKSSEMTVDDQLSRVDREISPFITNELHMFRAPGGAWDPDVEPPTSSSGFDLVGPIHWDIDGKDWEGSLYCRIEPCEPGPIGPRVRPDVTAHRYLDLAKKWKHGIVLMHDRVGDVGSSYARDVANRLIPELQAAGFVFAAPVLRFSPMKMRRPNVGRASLARATNVGDINGDGIPDKCEPSKLGVACALGDGRGGFKRASIWADTKATDIRLADVNGDGRADLCLGTGECGLAP